MYLIFIIYIYIPCDAQINTLDRKKFQKVESIFKKKKVGCGLHIVVYIYVCPDYNYLCVFLHKFNIHFYMILRN